jgi:hypothetical protein
MPTKSDTKTRPVTPIGNAKSTSTKPAEPDAGDDLDDLDDLPERPSIVSPGKLLGGVALMGGLLYLGYSWLGVPHVGSPNVFGALLGFVIVAFIAYVAAVVFLHIVHVHHASIGAWLARGAGRCLTWAGKRGERLLTSVYVWIGAAAVPARAWVRGLFERDDQGQADGTDPDDGGSEAELDRLHEAIRLAWCEPIQPGFVPRLVRTATAQFNVHLSETIAGAVSKDPDGAAGVLSARYGARVWIDGDQEPDGFRLRLFALPEDTPDPMIDRLREAIPRAWGRDVLELFQAASGRPGLYRAFVTKTVRPGCQAYIETADDCITAERSLGEAVGVQVRLRNTNVLATSISTLIVAPATQDAADPPGPAEAAEAPAAADPATTDGDNTVTTTTNPAAGQRAGGRIGKRVPPEGRPLIAMVDDFTPDNDEELHNLLLSLGATLHDLGVAMQDLHERCLARDVRLGKGAMTATNDAANGVVDAAGSVVDASRSFAAYYEGVSDEVAAGVQLPEHGDFITGNASGS